MMNPMAHQITKSQSLDITKSPSSSLIEGMDWAIWTRRKNDENSEQKHHREVPSLKLTQHLKIDGWILFSFWDGLFSGAVLVSGRVRWRDARTGFITIQFITKNHHTMGKDVCLTVLVDHFLPSHKLGGGFKYSLFSPLPGEIMQFDWYIFQMCWNHQPVKDFANHWGKSFSKLDAPPTSRCLKKSQFPPHFLPFHGLDLIGRYDLGWQALQQLGILGHDTCLRHLGDDNGLWLMGFIQGGTPNATMPLKDEALLRDC